MPRGRGKGGKQRKKGKNLGEHDKRELVFKEEGQEYVGLAKESVLDMRQSIRYGGWCNVCVGDVHGCTICVCV